MTTVFDKLRDPFDPRDLEFFPMRVKAPSQGGKGFVVFAAYKNARRIEDVLDQVCSPGGWTVNAFVTTS